MTIKRKTKRATRDADGRLWKACPSCARMVREGPIGVHVCPCGAMFASGRQSAHFSIIVK